MDTVLFFGWFVEGVKNQGREKGGMGILSFIAILLFRREKRRSRIIWRHKA